MEPVDIPKTELPASRAALLGAIAACVEVSMLHPTVSIKNALQQNQPVPKSLPVLYRGVFMNMLSIAPVTAVAFGINSAASSFLSGGRRALSSAEKMKVAVAAGAASSLVSTPTELVVVHQQRTGAGMVATAANIVRSHGPLALFRGGYPCCIREMVYGSGYLALSPIFTDWLVSSNYFGNAMTSSMVASVAVGLAAGVLTHPFDTAKTVMQGALDTPADPKANMFQTMRTVYGKQGLQGLYKGCLPRSSRIVGAVFVIAQVNTHVGPLLRPS